MTSRSQVPRVNCGRCNARLVIAVGAGDERVRLNAQQDIDGECGLYLDANAVVRAVVGKRGTGQYRLHECPDEKRKSARRAQPSKMSLTEALALADRQRSRRTASAKGLERLASEVREYRAWADEMLKVCANASDPHALELVIRALRVLRESTR